MNNSSLLGLLSTHSIGRSSLTLHHLQFTDTLVFSTADLVVLQHLFDVV